jgi:tetratricopeptide (TPR) repeat protein
MSAAVSASPGPPTRKMLNSRKPRFVPHTAAAPRARTEFGIALMSHATADPLATALEQHRVGNLPLAEQIYRQVIAQDPRQAHAWHLLGALCLQSGRGAEAVELIGRAIAIDPTNPEFYNHLGAAYGALGEHDSAVTSLRRAVQLAPQSATAHYNLGTALRNQGKLEDAAASFRHAVAANPDSAETHFNLANTLRELNRLEEAEASYREALRVRPNYVKAMINLGNVLRDRERLAESVDVLRAAVNADPQYANAHLNLGTVLRDVGQYETALEHLRRAIALEPTSAEAHNNLGTVLQSLTDFGAAEECYEEALRLNPELADAHFSRATHRLRQGDLAGGFAEYEWRWKCKSYSTRRFVEPRWDGSSLDGRTILLHAEQGLGDTLQFVRYAANVKSRGGTVIVECQPPLINILQSCAGIDRLVAAGSPLPRFDVQCPLLSLPSVLELPLDKLWQGAYLSADRELTDAWKKRLAARTGFRVGICWQGNRKHLFDRQRSFPLDSFAPIAHTAGVRLISLQKGIAAEWIAASSFEVLDLAAELDETAGAFVDTAAVIANLDLVITSDTSVAHLAGALGAPVWVALSAHGDWRWFTDRPDSAWYPTMRLFRQTHLDQWGDVFASMAEELRGVVAART